MRGCALLPGMVGSGPTGLPGTKWNPSGATWDSDGSYGDWYGGHEIGHGLGRKHVLCRGDEDKPDLSYPHPNGRISPSLSGDDAIYGFDIATRQIYGPDWHDVMTYCDKQWISDYTYEALITSLPAWTWGQQSAASIDQPREAQAPTDRLLVTGLIDPATSQVDLQPLFVIPNAPDLKTPAPGPYAIVLRDAAGTELARYPFTPDSLDGGPGAAEIGPVDLLAFSELVPYVAGTTRVDIEGPGAALLKTVTAGAGTPTVTVQSPNGGETLSGSTIAVSWTASDPDGDPLTFNVQYSPNNGASWEMLAQNVISNSVTLDAGNFVAGAQVRLRVSVSDGIHTASDESDGPFAVPNHAPSVSISQPRTAVTITLSQTLGLEADAYDADTGTMVDQQVRWASSLDGPLGSGAQLSVSSLSLGTHTITVTADDGLGGAASQTVLVTVAENVEPPAPGFSVFLPFLSRSP